MPKELKIWLRLEALAIALALLGLYVVSASSWWLFAVLILVPDVTMIGYLAGPKLGALSYNLGHSYALPVGLAVAGALLAIQVLISVALIWAIHIAFDRFLGYGLKGSSGFEQTHLGQIGRRRHETGADPR